RYHPIHFLWCVHGRRVETSLEREVRIGGGDDGEGLSIDEMPVEGVHFGRGESFDHSTNRLHRQVVPRRVDQQPTPWEPWSVRDGNGAIGKRVALRVPVIGY